MIPRIIHQVWSSIGKPIPEPFIKMGKTWKVLHPDWQYILWNDEMMEDFVKSNFPEYVEVFRTFKYDMQRWDMIRYLLLHKMGGLYVDCDCDCIEPVDSLLKDKSCYFSYEPDDHARIMDEPYMISTAFMAFTPKHPFIETILLQVQKELQSRDVDDVKWRYVLNTTGPFMIRRAYEAWPHKEEICLLPAEYISPFTKREVRAYLRGEIDDDIMENKLQKAVAVHYYTSAWV